MLARWPVIALLGLPWLAVLLAGSAWLVHHIDADARDRLLQRARSAADWADAVRAHVTSLGGLYVPRDAGAVAQPPSRVGETVATARSVDGAGQAVEQPLQLQGAFTAVRTLAVTAASTGAVTSLRMVSDNPINPASRVDGSERTALERLRSRQLLEDWSIDGGTLRYLRGLRADASCLLCHGDGGHVASTGSAPEPRSGRGYVLGAIVGATSVTIDAVDAAALGTRSWAGRAIGIGAVCLLGWAGSVLLVGLPLRRQVRYAQAIAGGDLEAAIDLAPVSPRPASCGAARQGELGALQHALERMHHSALLTVELLAAQPSADPPPSTGRA